MRLRSICARNDVAPVGWVERSDTHQCRCVCGDGYRFAPPILRKHAFAISRRALRPRFAINFPPSLSEGAGKTGCALHPRSRVHVHKKVRTRAYRYRRSIPAFPAQWLYGLLRALPGERLFCHRRPREAFASLGLNASTAASGPHDFAVRSSHTRQSQLSRPSHLTARS
jgi:hypothetical protein